MTLPARLQPCPLHYRRAATNMAHSDSELSSLSSAPPTDDEAAMAVDEPVGIAKYFKKESETPPPKREPSPPHEYVLADNPSIAVSFLISLMENDLWTCEHVHDAFNLLGDTFTELSQCLVHRHVPRAFPRSLSTRSATPRAPGY